MGVNTRTKRSSRRIEMKDISEISILGGEELVELKLRQAILYEIQAWTGS